MVCRFELTTPVLYLVFNRLNSVKKTFREIQKVKPKRLFVACDGPRTLGEKKKTDAVRKYILKNINWECDSKTLFRDKNLGCRHAVAGAIDWFFENVDEGIILEDDCLPNQSFFRFCQEMLERHRDESKIMSISGQNILGSMNIKEDYSFSKYFFCWGWATWKKSWKKMDLEMGGYKNMGKGNIKKLLPGFFERYLFRKRFNDNINGKINSWATSFLFSQICHGKLCIIPKNNLVENIGFVEFSTHTKENKYDSKYLHRLRNQIVFPLKHSKNIRQNKGFDRNVIFQDIKRVVLKSISS